ncbi:MoaD/ThiS family protein [Methylocystis echinoides]|uniref:MoaD/ThiS family protein n=1 Tax=Methylocystis echinoides TaxID=29468 RepID=UPI0034260AC5
MVKVLFTANIQRHVACPETEAAGATLREVLDNAFKENARARAYVLDDQAALRKHMTVFIDGRALRDRVRLSDPVSASSVVHVFQALSGG